MKPAVSTTRSIHAAQKAGFDRDADGLLLLMEHLNANNPVEQVQQDELQHHATRVLSCVLCDTLHIHIKVKGKWGGCTKEATSVDRSVLTRV